MINHVSIVMPPILMKDFLDWAVKWYKNETGDFRAKKGAISMFGAYIFTLGIYYENFIDKNYPGLKSEYEDGSVGQEDLFLGMLDVNSYMVKKIKEKGIENPRPEHVRMMVPEMLKAIDAIVEATDFEGSYQELPNTVNKILKIREVNED